MNTSVTASPDKADIDSWISPRGLWCLRRWPWDVTWSCDAAGIRSRTAIRGTPPSPASFRGGCSTPGCWDVPPAATLQCPCGHHEGEKSPLPPSRFTSCLSTVSRPPDMLPSLLHTRHTWIHTTGNGVLPLNSPTQVYKERPKTGQHGNTTSVLCLSAWTRTGLGPSFPTTPFPSCPPSAQRKSPCT